MWPFLLACAREPADPAGAPVILVSMDTLRADRLGVYGNKDGLTPSLDRFAAQSVVFENAWSQATTTAPSHASLFTSRYPPEQEVEDRRPNMTGMPTLAEVLSTYGWDTAAFVAGGDLATEMGIGKGFATWTSVQDFGSLLDTAPPALAWLDEHGDRPFLLFLHGYDAHAPYLKPTPFGYARSYANYQGTAWIAVHSSTELLVDGWLHPDFTPIAGVFADEARPRGPAARERILREARASGRQPRQATQADIEHVHAIYDGGVAYADVLFGRWMADLDARGWLDRATVVVFADHGEQLGEDGMFNHIGVSDAESHVPLMVRLPGGVGGGRRVSSVVELVDVMPTVLELAGATPPSGIRGHSLVPALHGDALPERVAFSVGGPGNRMLGARSTSGRLTYAGTAAYEPLTRELVATASLTGPSFTTTGNPDAAALRTAMVDWLRTLAPAGAAHSVAPLSDALKKELREHGYFEVR